MYSQIGGNSADLNLDGTYSVAVASEADNIGYGGYDVYLEYHDGNIVSEGFPMYDDFIGALMHPKDFFIIILPMLVLGGMGLIAYLLK